MACWKDVARELGDGDAGIVIGADNSARPASLADVADGDCFAVRLNDRWTAVDCDEPEKVPLLVDVARSAAEAGVAALLVDSGRPSHRHLFLACAPRLVAPVLQARGLEPRRVIRPPLAPHRLGLPVAVSSPSGSRLTVEQVLAVVRAACDDDGLRLVERLVRRRFPARVARALRFGHAAGGFPSESEARMAAAVAGVVCSLPFRWLQSALDASPLWTRSRHKGEAWKAAELKRIWSKALSHVASGDPRLSCWWAALDSFCWSGRSGGVDLAVAEALFRFGREFNRLTFYAPFADIALAAGVSVRTVPRALVRLERRGLVSVSRPGVRLACEFRLVVPDVVVAAGEHAWTDSAPAVALARSWENHRDDLGSCWGSPLTRQQARVWRMLGRRGPCDAATLAAGLDAHVVQVRRCLSVLVDRGFARRVREGRRWVFAFVEPSDPGCERAARAAVLVAEREMASRRRAAALAARTETPRIGGSDAG